jgi:hypothetical protein
MYQSLARPVVALAFALAGATASAAPALQPFEPASMARIIASEQGKPFVLVVWSLDCEFCLASLDALARERQARKDFNVVTIATDPAAPPLGPLMQQRLSSLGLSEHAWAYAALPPERLRFAIDRNWHGEMPRSYWFGADGQRTPYSGVITPAVIARLYPR